MNKSFGKNNKYKIYYLLSIILVAVLLIIMVSSYTLSWFMDESTTSTGEPNIIKVGELDMTVTTNFKFKNLVLAPDTIYITDQDNQDIATYIKTSDIHNIDGAYVRIKFETTRKNVGESDFVDNLDLFNIYFTNDNYTTSTDYSLATTKNRWFYNATDNYYYYLGGVYDQNIMFNAGYKTTNRMINAYASADVTIDFTIDCIQRQYGASEAVWTTAPQVFFDMVEVESENISAPYQK